MWTWFYGIGVVLLGSIGITATVGALAFSWPVWAGIFGGAATVGAGWGGHTLWSETKIKNDQKRSADKDARIAELENANASYQAELDGLETSLELANSQNNQLSATVARMQTTINTSEANNAAQNREIRSLRRERADLQRELDERAGNGINTSFNYAKYYYSSKDINTCLQMAVIKRLGGFENGSKFLLANVFQKEHAESRVLLLPAMIASRINSYLSDNLELLKILKQNSECKLIFPYLDTERQHWCTAEIIFRKNTQARYSVICFMHDPRGGGQFPKEFFQNVQSAIIPLLEPMISSEKVEFFAPESPYKTCRHSKVDKISCGPIVASEIELCIRGQSLDRRIPYPFGASELVADQQQGLNENLIAERSQFLKVGYLASNKG